jgi:hypothetical protein
VDGVGVYHAVKGKTIAQLLAVGHELLSSEGVEPAWVPFTEAERADAESPSA